MDEVTQQNAALVEEAAAAAESLEEQAENLSTSVSIFKMDGAQQTRAIAAPRAVAVAKRALAAPARRPAAAAKPKALHAKRDDESGEWAEF
jgi:hypothetical protein